MERSSCGENVRPVRARTRDVKRQERESYLAEYPAKKEVVFRVVGDQQLRLWVGIEQLVRRRTEKPSVRVERGLHQLRHELPEDAAAVDAGLIQTGKVDELDLHATLEVRLCAGQRRTEKLYIPGYDYIYGHTYMSHI